MEGIPKHNMRILFSWRLVPLLIANLFSILLFSSLLFEPGHSFWTYWDNVFFWRVNQSLAWGEGWCWFWAITNNRLFDVLSAGFIGFFYLHNTLRTRESDWALHLTRFLVIAMLALLMVQLGKALPIEKLSPTSIYPEALRLSELVREIATKDSSGDSFPGDHGVALFIFAGGACIYLPAGQRIAVVLASLFFVMPRLVSGAHWLSDVLVGAVSLGVLGLAWFLFTPIRSLTDLRFVPLLAHWIQRLTPGAIQKK